MKTKINISRHSQPANVDNQSSQTVQSSLAASVQHNENFVTVSIDIECEPEDTLSIFRSQIPFLMSVLGKNSPHIPGSEAFLNARYQY